MLNEKMSGIYKITNLVNGKFYIGSSVNLQRRFGEHWTRLRNNKHDNVHLQSSWFKYGEDNFIFEIIDYCNDEDLLNLEQFYIDTLQPQYNICQTAGSCLGRKLSEEHKEKLSISHRGIKMSEETKLKIKESNIGKVFSEESKLKMSESRKGIMFSEKHRQNISKTHYLKGKTGLNHPRSKKVIQLTLAGEVITEFSAIKEAARETGLSQGHISAVCCGKRKSTGGYFWKYKDAI